jgi:AcrR family transcriptional regulator
MREIARAVGVRESAIYHHFANKEALLATLLIGSGDEKMARLERLLEGWQTRPVRELLHALANQMLDAWELPQEKQLFRMMCTEGFRLAEEGKFEADTSFRKVRLRLRQLFEDLATTKRIKPLSPDLLAMEFVSPMMMVRNMSAVTRGAMQLPPGVTWRSVLESHVQFFCDAVILP